MRKNIMYNDYVTCYRATMLHATWGLLTFNLLVLGLVLTNHIFRERREDLV